MKRAEAYYLAGAALAGLALGRDIERLELDEEAVHWESAVEVLWQWGDFLDLIHREAMIVYGGELAEALGVRGPDGRGRSRFEDRENVAAFLAGQECAECERRAVEIVREYLVSWREAHPDVAAYVEEWLDLGAARRLTELMLQNNVRDLRSVAEVLARRGELSGAEVVELVEIQ